MRVSKNIKNEDLKCTKCNLMNDYNGNHSYNCKNGKYNPSWRHDKINKKLCELIDGYTNNYQLEPRKMDVTEDRPDIVVHDTMKMDDNKYTKAYYDLMGNKYI